MGESHRAVWAAALGVVLSVGGAWAGPPPHPEPGENRALTGGKPAAEFFPARLSRADHREAVARAREEYLAARKPFAEAVAELAKAGEGGGEELQYRVDRLEKQLSHARGEYLTALEERGPIATSVELKLFEDGERVEYWYVTDGACWLPGADADARRRAAQKAAAGLLRGPRPEDGCPGTLHFCLVCPKSGQPLADEKPANGSPFHSYTVMLGLRLGRTVSGFGCYAENTFETGKGNCELLLRGSSVPPPEGFRAGEDVCYRTPSGKECSVRVVPADVRTQAYVSADGYARVWTAARSRFRSDLVANAMRERLRDSLAWLLENVGQE